jgi:beta-lysine 5,6-aminomutase alpha subunit
VGVTTGQSIQLLGMLTEAMHTPYLMDRALAIKNARLTFGAARSLGENIEVRSNSWLSQRGAAVLDSAIAMLEGIARDGLFAANAEGRFADIKRPPDGGKGRDGVVPKAENYVNPLYDLLAEGAHADA